MEITTLEQLNNCIKNRTPLLFGYNDFIYGCIVTNISIEDTIPYHWELQDKIINGKESIPTIEKLIEYINSNLNEDKNNPLLYLFLNITQCVEMYNDWDYVSDEYSQKLTLVPVNVDFEFWNDSESENVIRPGDSDFIRTMELEELKNYTSKVKKIKKNFR